MSKSSCPPTTSLAVASSTAGSDLSAQALLDAIVAAGGGQHRQGQQQMCASVAEALATSTDLVVEAPTGIGKTYAVAAAAAHWLAGDDAQRVVIATATRALQDQLIDIDLPVVAEVSTAQGAPFSFRVLKGRSNYLCRAKAAEATGSLLADDREVAEQLQADAEEAASGERTRLSETTDEQWRLLSVSSTECPGARHCSHGDSCWAEQARREADQADVLVVNSSLYAAHLLADGGVLPEHEAVVFDEAHALADILVDAAAVMVTAGRLRSLERSGRSWAEADDLANLKRAADGLARTLEGAEGEQDPAAGDLAVHLAEARVAASAVARSASSEASETDLAQRVATAASRLAADLAVIIDGDDLDRVVWSERGELWCAPVRATELGRDLLWSSATTVCTSATLRGGDGAGGKNFQSFLVSLGAPAETPTLAVDSPFDPASQGILYVPKGRIPSPRQPGWAEGVRQELWALVCAAGGRTLALFTSRAATEAAVEDLRSRVGRAASEGDPAGDIEVLSQWDGPRHRLIDALRERRRVVICATRSFWTGIDIPGDACVVVAMDRLPFPRPDDPLIRARRQRAEAEGANAFLSVDVPAAATQLAQGAGRLLRSPHDKGVVAVLDTRLAEARWRQRILGALPAFRRCVDPDEVAKFLADA